MRTFKLTVAYDGTDYYGWQWQPAVRSVEGVLRDTFLATFHQIDVYMVGASRTDAGVHAQGQVVRVITPLNLDPSKMMTVWNAALPGDIAITDLVEVCPEFHPQRSVLAKTYEYRFFTQRPHPAVQRFGFYLRRTPDMKKLAAALSFFVGTHDFKAFCKEEDGKNTVRQVNAINIEACAITGATKLTFVGPSFLRHMIRRMVGAALTVAHNRAILPQAVRRALIDKEPNKLLPTAPAKGLCLKHIQYSNHFQVQ